MDESKFAERFEILHISWLSNNQLLKQNYFKISSLNFKITYLMGLES